MEKAKKKKLICIGYQERGIDSNPQPQHIEKEKVAS
jgi:hypothetical protein